MMGIRPMPTTRKTKFDVFSLPNYGPIEAAAFLHVPYDTLHYWISKESGPLITPANKNPLLLSFKNVIECYVLDLLRRIHGISMPRVRFSVETIKALQQAKHLMRSDSPLADHDLRVDRRHLYVYDLHGKIVDLTVGGQVEWPELIEKYLQRVVRDRGGVAQKFYPLLRKHDSLADVTNEPQLVSMDPRLAFGKPVIVGTGISTEVIAGRLTAGDEEKELAHEYGRTIEEIRAAAEFEGVPTAA